MNSGYLVSSKDNDQQTRDILTNIKSWDYVYPHKLGRAYWSGQLTDIGVQQLYELGAYLRSRYIEKFAFLSPTFMINTNTNPTEEEESGSTDFNGPASLYYISSNFARTIQSADSLLQGLYPMEKREATTSIPIYVDNKETWFYPTSSCKRSKKKREENEVKLIEMEDEKMVDIKRKLTDYYGRKGEDVEWLHVLESFLCRLSYGIDLPPESVVNEGEIREFIGYVNERVCKYHGMDRESLRLTVGGLLKVLVDNMDVEGKMVLYSGHDGTIQRLLMALSDGDFRFPWPKYGASLIFEVWEKEIVKDEDKENFVMGFKDWWNGNDRTRMKYVRVLYEGNVMRIDGEEFVSCKRLKEMWDDLMIDKESYWNRECVC